MKKYFTLPNIGLGLSILVAISLIMAGISGLSGAEEFVKNFEKFHLSEWRVIIGLGAIASAILFVVPQTKNWGTMLLCSYYGGAIMVHMVNDEPFIPAVVFLVLTWVISWMRGVKPIEL